MGVAVPTAWPCRPSAPPQFLIMKKCYWKIDFSYFYILFKDSKHFEKCKK